MAHRRSNAILDHTYHRNYKKILQHVRLHSLDAQLLGATVFSAARLTPTEGKVTYIKICPTRTVKAINTYRFTAVPKLLAVETLLFQGKPYTTKPYTAKNPSNARRVLHGFALQITDEELCCTLELEEATLLTARGLGTTHSILVPVEEPKIPIMPSPIGSP